MQRIVVVTLLCTLAACSRAKTDPASTVSDQAVLHPDAIRQIEAMLAEKDARTPAQQKISSQLLYQANGMPGAVDEKGPGLEPINKPDSAGRVLVDISATVSDDLLGSIAKSGGAVVYSSADHGVIRARVKLDSIEPLAANPSVSSVRPAFLGKTARANVPGLGHKFPALTREQRIENVKAAVRSALGASRADLTGLGGTSFAGSVTSQGDKGHAADRARRFYAVDGTGVKVGVLSDSDDFKEQSISTGDLPPDTVTVPGQDGRPGAGEGTAMMEIVHDLAPGAKLFFATAFNGPQSFADNIRTLRFTYGCDIIVDDVIYFFESPYEDDIIAQAVDDVAQNGALYFSSAGNEGHYDDGTSGTWEGDFKSGGLLATLPSGYTVHDFGAGVISDRIEAAGGPLILHWADPGNLDHPASSNDYDLFILSSDLRRVVVASTDIQNGTQLPFEFLGFFIPPNFRVVIAKKPGAADRALRTVLFGGQLALATPGAVYGHSAARGATALAAVDARLANGGEFTGGPTTPIELFSSDGFRRIFYDRNNNPINGDKPTEDLFGTFAGDMFELRRKPELTAADGVSTTLPSFSGLNPFFGTSAAAPHAGAVAALLKSAVPSASTGRIRRALASGALDIMAAGPDRNSGAGIISAFNSLRDVGAAPGVTLELASVTTTPAGGAAFIVPGGGGNITVALHNAGGAAATAVTGKLASATPGVTVTSADASFGDLATDGTATNTPAFAFTLASSASCGLRADFSLTVSFTGNGKNPTVFVFSVTTGKPAAAPVSTSYSGPDVLIPDADAVGVNVPLAVSGVGLISSMTFAIGGTTCNTIRHSTTVGLDHTWVGDLVATLTSPGGTTVTLFSRPGGAFNSGHNFCHTVLSDAAASSIQTISSSGAPWTGSFKPARPLASFNGESANGTWVLNVSDHALFDTGSVRAFSIDATGFNCGP